MNNIYNNKEAFLLLKPFSLYPLITLVILSLLLLAYFAYTTKIYDSYTTKGFVTCDNECYLTIFIPSNISPEKIKINNKYRQDKLVKIEIIIDEKTLESYKKLQYSVNNDFNNNEIITASIYYNKQRIITKLFC